MAYIPDVWRDRRVQGALGGAVLVGLGVGMGIGYILAKHKWKTKYVLVNPDQIVETVDDSDDSQMVLLFGSNSETSTEDIPILTIDAPEEVILTRVNVFTKEDDDWDYDTEVANRTKDVPYIIHQEEFIADEMNYRQETLTYYAGDDIMADSADTPIYGYQGLMGELKFGHGSKDPSVVYIRNEGIHMEWEVLLHTGLFSVEVMGLSMEQDAENEIRHSHNVLKFRGD